MSDTILFSFLELDNSQFSYPVFRKKIDSAAKQEGMYRYKLPIASRDGWDKYDVSFSDNPECLRFQAKSTDSIGMTKKWLMELLLTKVKQVYEESEYYIGRHFIPNISFVISTYKEGQGVIQLEPYYLEERESFGFIIDYRFKPFPGFEKSRGEKIYSLSLSPDGSKNKNYYVDKLKIITDFLKNQIPKIFPLQNDGMIFDVARELTKLPSCLLNEKTFIFKNGESKVQFQGLKTNKPLINNITSPLYIFIFENSKINIARQLVLALRGKLYTTFSGMEAMFGVPFSNDNIASIIVEDYSQPSLASIKTQLEVLVDSHRDSSIVGIFAGIEKNFDDDNFYSPYYTIKSYFLKLGLAVQAITVEQALKKDGFKWSISSIALQLFVKLGGIPWKVKPQNDNCLIFGISSAHIMDQNKNISKYFAYSLCFDSSGLYKRLHILGRSSDKRTYIDQLSSEIRNHIAGDITDRIEKCIIHVPFKLKREEMQCLRDSIRQLKNENQNISFTVIKINVNNRFFGYSSYNSRIPLAGTYIRLSRDEYLIWFEGLQQRKTQVASAQNISNPVHVQFLFGDELTEAMIQSYLQDIVNLSGANWRGFNAKHEPVTTLYPELIAKFAGKFDQYGLDLQIGDSAINKVWFI